MSAVNVRSLRARGFDRSANVPFTRLYRVVCSQCEALVLNGVPTHERGCPQDKGECRGCGAPIPARHRWCEECAP